MTQQDIIRMVLPIKMLRHFLKKVCDYVPLRLSSTFRQNAAHLAPGTAF